MLRQSAALPSCRLPAFPGALAHTGRNGEAVVLNSCRGAAVAARQLPHCRNNNFGWAGLAEAKLLLFLVVAHKDLGI